MQHFNIVLFWETTNKQNPKTNKQKKPSSSREAQNPECCPYCVKGTLKLSVILCQESISEELCWVRPKSFRIIILSPTVAQKGHLGLSVRTYILNINVQIWKIMQSFQTRNVKRPSLENKYCSLNFIFRLKMWFIKYNGKQFPVIKHKSFWPIFQLIIKLYFSSFSYSSVIWRQICISKTSKTTYSLCDATRVIQCCNWIPCLRKTKQKTPGLVSLPW